MKKILLLVILLNAKFSFAQLFPIDCGKIYVLGSYSIQAINPDYSGTFTVTAGANLYNGPIAVGPSFGFTNTTNPAIWVFTALTMHYFDGTNFVPAPLSTLMASNIFGIGGIGGSKNFIYGIANTGEVYKYNGTGTSTLVTTLPDFNRSSGGVPDIIGDDADNFYVMNTKTTPSLTVYNSSGIPICSYSINGIPSYSISAQLAGGLSIIGNTVNVTTSSSWYKGIISGSQINFTATAGPSPTTYPYGAFASCSLPTVYPSGITSVQGATITCFNSPITLSLTAQTPISTYSWLGPGIVGAATNQTVFVNAPGVYTCNTISSTCPPKTSSATYTIINAQPVLTLNVNSSASITCMPATPVTLAVNGATTYTWSPALSLNTTMGNSVIASPLVTTDYTVKGATGACSQSAVFTVSVNPTPTLSNLSGSPTVCAASALSLSVSGANTYTWLPGNLTGSTVLVNPLTNTHYTVNGASDGCASSLTLPVVVNPTPALLPSASPVSICNGNASTLTVANALSYTWQPGNLNGTTLTVSPVVNTVYSVSGTNGYGCVSTATLQVTVNPIPSPVITAAAMPVCANVNATLTASGANTFSWSNSTATASSISFSVAAPFTCTLFGTSNNCTGTTTLLVSSIPSPTLSVSFSPSSACNGSPVSFSVSGASTYTWYPGLATGNTYTATHLSGSIYTVTGLSVNGCYQTQTLNVASLPMPAFSVQCNPPALCVGTSATLSCVGATNYSFNPGNSSGSTMAITPSQSTSYTVSSGNGTCTTTKTIAVTVNALPLLTLSASAFSVCSGNTLSLSATGANTYTWNPGASNGSLLATNPLSTTLYSLTGKDLNGCSSNTTQLITVAPKPVINATATPGSMCSGQLALLAAGGGLTYTWQPGVISGNTITVSPTVTTLYTVTGTDALLCSNQTTLGLTILPAPTLSANLSQTVLCVGETSSISVIGADTYTWNSNTSGPILVANPQSAGPLNYYVVGTGSNGCSSKVIYFFIDVQLCNSINSINTPHNIGKFYPNPSTGEFVFELTSPIENASIHIYNTLGELVLTQKVNLSKNYMSLAGENNGVYVVAIKQNNAILLKTTLIKQ